MSEISNTPVTGPARRAPRAVQRSSAILYAALALAAFAVGVALLVFLVVRAREIGGAGLTGQVYYTVLLAMGLAVAFALFGALRAHASLKGTMHNLTVELGGAAAMFALVVAGGLKFVPQVSAFSFSVLLRTAQGAPALTEGFITLVLEGAPIRSSIDRDGRALFENLPASHRGQPARLELSAREWRFAGDRVDTTVTLAGAGAVLNLTRASTVCCIAGSVRDEAGGPVGGALVTIDSMTARSDAAGWFRIELPAGRRDASVGLRVHANGFRSWEASVPVDTAPVQVVLTAVRPR